MTSTLQRPRSSTGTRATPRFIFRSSLPSAPHRPGTSHTPVPGIDPSYCFQYSSNANEDNQQQKTSKPGKPLSVSVDFNKCLSRDEAIVDGKKRYVDPPPSLAGGYTSMARSVDAVPTDRSKLHFISTTSVPSHRLRNFLFNKCVDREQRSKSDRTTTALMRPASASVGRSRPQLRLQPQEHEQQQKEEECSDTGDQEADGRGEEHPYQARRIVHGAPNARINQFQYFVVGASQSQMSSRKIVLDMELQSGRTHHNSIMADIQGSKRVTENSSKDAGADFGHYIASLRPDYPGRFQLPFYNVSYTCMDNNVAVPQFQPASVLSTKQRQLRDETLRKSQDKGAAAAGGGGVDAAAGGSPAQTPEERRAMSACGRRDGEHSMYRGVERRAPSALTFGKMCGRFGHINGARPTGEPQITSGSSPTYSTQDHRLQNINIGKSTPRKPPTIGRKFHDIQLYPKYHLVEKTVITPRIPPLPTGAPESHAQYERQVTAEGSSSPDAARTQSKEQGEGVGGGTRNGPTPSRPTSAPSGRSLGARASSCSYTLDLDVTRADNIVHPRAIRNIKFAPDTRLKKVENDEGIIPTS